MTEKITPEALGRMLWEQAKYPKGCMDCDDALYMHCAGAPRLCESFDKTLEAMNKEQE